MKTTTITLYQFNELTEKAKERARDWYREGGGYAWSEEWHKSLEAFTAYYPVKVTDWEVGAHCHSFIRFEVSGNDNIEDLQGVRLRKYLQAHYPIDVSGSCPFTGYCGDEDLLDPIRAFINKPETTTTFSELMKDCLESWVKAYQADMEDQQTDEYVEEAIEANEYDFLENGERA